MAKVLITGATGFIGSNLVAAALERGHRVRALVRKGSPREAQVPSAQVEIAYGDMTDRGSLEQACRGQEIVFNCAGVVSDWEASAVYQAVNVDGVDHLCTAAAGQGVARLVHVSTNDVFGRREGVLIDETCPMQQWGESYPDSKIDGDAILWRRHRQQGLPVTLVYPCWVYGRGDRSFIPLTADAIVKRELIFWSKRTHVWPTCIDNLTHLMLLVAEHPRAQGEGYLVHDGEMVTFRQLCTTLAEALGVPPIRTRIPYALAWLAAVAMEGWARLRRSRLRPLLTTYIVKNLGSRLQYSIGKAERELGWTPPVSYRQGMAETIAWLKTRDPESFKEK